MQGTQVPSLAGEESLEKGMVTHSTILAWRIPWTEEPVRLQSMGLKESDTTKQLSLSNKCYFPFSHLGTVVVISAVYIPVFVHWFADDRDCHIFFKLFIFLPFWFKIIFKGIHDLVVKNMSANTGDMGLIPSLGRFHMLQGNWARAPQLLKCVCPRTHALQQEKPPQWEVHTLQLERSPCSPQLKTACTAKKTQYSQK